MGWKTGPDGDEVRQQVSVLDPSTANPADVSPRESTQGCLYPCATFFEPICKNRSSRRKKQASSSISRGKHHTGRPARSVDRLQRHAAATGLKVKPYDGKLAARALLDGLGRMLTSDRSP